MHSRVSTISWTTSCSVFSDSHRRPQMHQEPVEPLLWIQRTIFYDRTLNDQWSQLFLSVLFTLILSFFCVSFMLVWQVLFWTFHIFLRCYDYSEPVFLFTLYFGGVLLLWEQFQFLEINNLSFFFWDPKRIDLVTEPIRKCSPSRPKLSIPTLSSFPPFFFFFLWHH